MNTYKITKHFSWKEFERSSYAVRNDIDNTIPEEKRANVHALCENVLEAIREEWGTVKVTSGYRCDKLNLGIGSSLKSQHGKGEAADIQFGSGVDIKKVFKWIKENLDYDQVIFEFDSWIHVSFTENNRKKSLIAYRENGKTKYKLG